MTRAHGGRKWKVNPPAAASKQGRPRQVGGTLTKRRRDGFAPLSFGGGGGGGAVSGEAMRNTSTDGG